MTITDKSYNILMSLAEGCSCEDILTMFPNYTMEHISAAATEALSALSVHARPNLTTYRQQIIEIRKVYPRAYQKWDDRELGQLLKLYQEGCSLQEIARNLQRNPRAVSKRLRRIKTGQLSAPSPIVPRVMVQNINQTSSVK